MAVPKKPAKPAASGVDQKAIAAKVERIQRPPQTVNEYGNSINKPMSGRASYTQHQRMVNEGKSYLRNLDQVVKDERVARGQPAVPKLPAGAKAALDKAKKKR